MARRYAPSPNEVGAANIERAARDSRKKPVGDDTLTKVNQISLARPDAATEHSAALTVIELAAQHPCQLDPERGITTCDDPFHATDVAELRDLLDAFGLLPDRTPDETWLPVGQAARSLGISEVSVRRKVKSGQLRGALIGRPRILRIDPDQVRNLAEDGA